MGLSERWGTYEWRAVRRMGDSPDGPARADRPLIEVRMGPGALGLRRGSRGREPLPIATAEAVSDTRRVSSCGE